MKLENTGNNDLRQSNALMSGSADDDNEVGAPEAEHAEGGLGGEVEGDPANKTVKGEPASSGGKQPGAGN